MTNIFNRAPCPVWGEQAGGLVHCFGQDSLISSDSLRVFSPRAGGTFQIGKKGLPSEVVKVFLEMNLTPRDKANLSFRIFRHNWDLGLLRLRNPTIKRSKVGVDALYQSNFHDRYLQVTDDIRRRGILDQPPAEERLLSFMQELVWQNDRAIQAPTITEEEGGDYSNYLCAASACATKGEMEEFWQLALKRGWVQSVANAHNLAREPMRASLTLEARLWVEEQVREQGAGHQGFVAMWFDNEMKLIYQQYIAPAIKAAGYKPFRIDDDTGHSDNLVDRILAAIRQSRFIVADFTCGSIKDDQGNPVYLDRGGVYYEAGFAYGLGKPVIYTCRKNVVKHLHFDICQLNHLPWTDGDELARKLRARIVRQFDLGPVTAEHTDGLN